MKHTGGQVDETIERYRTTLIRLRNMFLAYGVVTTEATVLQMRDDMRAQTTEKSNQALEGGE